MEAYYVGLDVHRRDSVFVIQDGAGAIRGRGTVPTTPAGLAQLCQKREPDGTLCFRRPDGRILPDVPPSVAVCGDPVQILRTPNEAEGLRLDVRTTCPRWLGERLDLG